MSAQKEIKGVIVAAVTPLDRQNRPNLDNLQLLIRTLADEQVDGILLLGTTGEGPSISIKEQEEIISAGLEAAGEMFVLSCIGTVSVKDAVSYTKKAYDIGVDGVVVLPPYYYNNPKTEGLLSYFKEILNEAVPENKQLFLYHIPQLTGVPISVELLEGLLNFDEKKIGGVKDSQGDIQNTILYCQKFPGLNIFVGTDRLLLEGMKNGAAGCVTAGANVLAPLDVAVYRSYLKNENPESLQSLLTEARLTLEKYMPFPPTLKSLLEKRFGTPGWEVRAPLVSLWEKDRDQLIIELRKLSLQMYIPWIFQGD